MRAICNRLLHLVGFVALDHGMKLISMSTIGPTLRRGSSLAANPDSARDVHSNEASSALAHDQRLDLSLS